MHLPLQQVCPVAQTVPQAPQLLSSLLRLTQTPLQQLSPVPQMWPHAPQLVASPLAFVQMLLHRVLNPGLHVDLQTPMSQNRVSLGSSHEVLQTLPHNPQLLISLENRFRQIPLQQSPLAHSDDSMHC